MSVLVLASKSPRRREILANAGIEFVVRIADVEEVRSDGEDPENYVRRLAISKSRAVDAAPGEVVLGADTVVALEHHVLEKPADTEDAARMLRLLSGREHSVITGISLRSADREIVETETTLVRFSPLSESEISAYVASGEPMDKAGAYAIQGLASKFVEAVNGCYFNVVGLPVARVYRCLKQFGR